MEQFWQTALCVWRTEEKGRVSARLFQLLPRHWGGTIIHPYTTINTQAHTGETVEWWKWRGGGCNTCSWLHPKSHNWLCQVCPQFINSIDIRRIFLSEEKSMWWLAWTRIRIRTRGPAKQGWAIFQQIHPNTNTQSSWNTNNNIERWATPSGCTTSPLPAGQLSTGMRTMNRDTGPSTSLWNRGQGKCHITKKEGWLF